RARPRRRAETRFASLSGQRADGGRRREDMGIHVVVGHRCDAADADELVVLKIRFARCEREFSETLIAFEDLSRFGHLGSAVRPLMEAVAREQAAFNIEVLIVLIPPERCAAK